MCGYCKDPGAVRAHLDPLFRLERRVQYCPLCGESLSICDFTETLRTTVDDGLESLELVRIPSEKKSKPEYEPYHANFNNLDDIDISRELEWLKRRNPNGPGRI